MASEVAAVRKSILGVQVAAVEPEQAVELVLAAAREPRPFSVSALAVHGVMEGVRDRDMLTRLNALDLVVADGQPVRWALNWIHRSGLRSRVYGPDLMRALLERAAAEGIGVYLYGSTDETLTALVDRLENDHQGIIVSGYQASRFRQSAESERLSDIDTIRRSGAGIVFVGLGCPRQEIWAYENARDLGVPVVAVGAAFDYWAGNLRRPPRWAQRRGLEWAFRLAQEPRRLWRRYLLLNPWFASLLIREKLGLRRASDEPVGSPPSEVRPG